MDRETKTIQTPIEEHEVVLKAWLTGREQRNLQKILQEGMNFSMEGRRGDTKIESQKMAEVMQKAEDEAIKTVVVSIDGEEEGRLDKILDMRGKDYDFVIEKINEVTQGEDFTQAE